MLTFEEYTYWIEKKRAYEFNLKHNLGHTDSIKLLLIKIVNKLENNGFSIPSSGSTTCYP